MNRVGITAVALLVAFILAFVFWQTRDVYDNEKMAADAPHTWHLRFGHNMPVDSAMHEAALLYAKNVETKSGGRIHITVYPNQELGDDHQMVEMARQGKLDIILTPTAKMSVALPSMQYVDLPFYFPTREDLYEMLDGEPGQMLLDELKQIDLIGVTFWENGFKHFTANAPLLRAEDFRGKTFRIMKSRLIQSQFETLGAETRPIDFHETRKALADGVVDGQENPLIAIKSMGINEVQSDLTLSSHGYMGYVFSISAKTFQTLPADLQTLLYQSARDLTPYEREQTHKREAALLDSMKQGGLHVHTLTPEARAELTRKLSPIATAYEEVIGPHILARTQELLLDKYGPSPEKGKQIVIGLNIDLSMSSKIGGMAIKRGAELAVEDINHRGGVLGKPLVLISKDQRGLAAEGDENVLSFIKRPDVVAIIGGVRSSVIDASIDSAQKAQIPYLIPWATSTGLIDKQPPHSVFFRISANNRDAVAFMMDTLLRRSKRPAILYENSILGRDSLERAREIISAQHRTFTQTIPFNISQTNFERELDSISRSGADSLLLIANSIEGVQIVNAMAKQRITIPVVSHWGVTSNHFFEMTEDSLKHLDFRFLQTFLFTSSHSPHSSEVAERYVRRYGVSSIERIPAPSGVAQSYDLVQLLALAIKKAGTTDRASVRDAMEHLPPYQGLVRYYSPAFTPQKHEALGSEDYQMARYRSDGAIIPAAESK